MKTSIFRKASLIATFIVMGYSTLSAQASTPEAALEEMVTTQKPEVFEKHLPLGVQQALDQLSEKDKLEALDKFLIARKLEHEHLKLRRSDKDDQWELVNEVEIEGTIILSNTFVSGTEAILRLKAREKQRPWEQFIVSMRLEEGEWRVIEIGPWRGMSLESEELMREILPGPRDEAAAQEYLGTLNRALARYATLYPAVGFPASLQSLSGAGSPDEEPSAQHAGLIDPAINGNSFTRAGYEYRYVLLDPGQPERQGNYQIVAMPVEWGKTGARSFFTDASAVVRFTTEARPATDADSQI
jgi:hypothetical protein